MQNHNSLKKTFLKKWIRGLQICKASKENMSLLERKKAIKLSADLAMASTRNAKRHWNHALVSKVSKDSQTGSLANQILQGSFIKAKCCLSSKDDHFLLNATYTKLKTTMMVSPTSSRNISKHRSTTCHKKLKNGSTRKSSGASNSYIKVKKARSIAERLVKKRTYILKGLVPGGEFLDEYSLVKEALDYIVSLRAQVEVMHHFANSPQLPI